MGLINNKFNLSEGTEVEIDGDKFVITGFYVHETQDDGTIYRPDLTVDFARVDETN